MGPMKENREPGSIYVSMEKSGIKIQQGERRNEAGTTVYLYNDIFCSQYERK